jgi:hypothetical protein
MPKRKGKGKPNRTFAASVAVVALLVGILLVRGSATGVVGGKPVESNDYGTSYTSTRGSLQENFNIYSAVAACKKASTGLECHRSEDSKALLCENARRGKGDIVVLNIGTSDPSYQYDVDSGWLGISDVDGIIAYCASLGNELLEV